MELPGLLQNHTLPNIGQSGKLPKWSEWSLFFHIYAIVNGISYPHLLLNPQPVLDWMPPEKSNNSFQLWILPFVTRFESHSQRKGISFSAFPQRQQGSRRHSPSLALPVCCHGPSQNMAGPSPATPLHRGWNVTCMDLSYKRSLRMHGTANAALVSS